MSSARSRLSHGLSRLKNPRWSLRFRITGLIVGVLAFTLLLFSGILYNALLNSQQTSFDVDLHNHAVDMANSIRVDAFGEVRIAGEAAPAAGKIVPFAVGSAFIQILDSESEVVLRSHNLGSRGRLPVEPNDLRLAKRGTPSFRSINYRQIFGETGGRNSRYRMVSYPLSRGLFGDFILQVAVPMTFLEESERGLKRFLGLGIPMSLALAAIAGLLVSGRALRPINAIIAKAQQLGSANLSERLPVPRVDDELRRLSLTLNALLNRLQLSFESQERFVADASHELKTPLAILRGELDLMRSRTRTPEETQAFLATASQELDQLSRLVEDLLILARVDAGTACLQFQATRMDEILLEVLSRLEPLARAKEVKFHLELLADSHAPEPFEASFEASADADLLRVLIKNLVENAVKFSPSRAQVEIVLQESPEWLSLTVRNEGPGIPPEVQSRVFERFFRQNTSAPGAGLGLAIAQRIAQAHRGEIAVRSPAFPDSALSAHEAGGDGGAEFTARIPKG